MTAHYRTPPQADSGRVRQIGVDQIRPGRAQMRREFDPVAIAGLAESLRHSGMIQPVVVRPAGEGYELLAGERRWRAAQQAGLHDIPALIREDIDDDEALVLGLVENLQRESLTPMETAHGLRVLAEQLALTHGEAAERIGKSRVYVTNFLRLLNLCAPVQQMVNEGALSMGHARALAALPEAAQERAARRCVAAGWSVRTLEARLRGVAGASSPRAQPAGDDDWQRLARALQDHLGHAVELGGDARGRGQMTISFHSFDELDGLLERLGFAAPL